MTDNLNIDLSELNALAESAGDLKSGDEVVGLITSAKFAQSKSGNDMIKIALKIVSSVGYDTTVWTQLMLRNPANPQATVKYLSMTRNALVAILGEAPSAINADLLKELVGKTVVFKIKVEFSDQWGVSRSVDRWLRPADPEDNAIEINLDFGDEVSDVGGLAY